MTLHERAVALSESWGCSYKEALEVERGIDVNLKTKVKEASSPSGDFYAWLAPGGSQQSALKEGQPRPEDFFTWLGFPTT